MPCSGTHGRCCATPGPSAAGREPGQLVLTWCCGCTVRARLFLVVDGDCCVVDSIYLGLN